MSRSIRPWKQRTLALVLWWVFYRIPVVGLVNWLWNKSIRHTSGLTDLRSEGWLRAGRGLGLQVRWRLDAASSSPIISLQGSLAGSNLFFSSRANDFWKLSNIDYSCTINIFACMRPLDFYCLLLFLKAQQTKQNLAINITWCIFVIRFCFDLQNQAPTSYRKKKKNVWIIAHTHESSDANRR